MMNCRQLAELLIDFVSDELPPERKQHLEHHLQKCPPCLAYLETYRATIRMTRQLPCVPVPPELLERMRKALEE
jgi:anti-sigma factor RsiW